MFTFEVRARDGEARAGQLVTPRGVIETPSFVPVGTQGTVKGVSAQELWNIGTQIIIVNTYHLHLQPGENLVERMGGLHQFMGWHGPLMSDSGGFQIFSQGAAKEHGVGKIASIFPEESDRGGHLKLKGGKTLVKVDKDGVSFTSYLDGSRHRFTPETVISIERKLGADIIFALDECTSPLHSYEYTKAALERTHRWATLALEAFRKTADKKQALMGITQGGAYRNLREKSAAFIASQGFDGYAIGGALGRSKDEMYQVLEWTIPHLQEDRPRHLLGIGEIGDIFGVVKQGVDLFDCVAPTRMARTGTLLNRKASRFRMHILNARFKEDPLPIEEDCRCYTCCHYSRSYLRHLFMAKEISAIQLAAIHNLYFTESLMRKIRTAIRNGTLAAVERSWLS